MDNKQKYILKILNKYGVLVNFDGEPSKQNLPSPLDNETFNQWLERIFDNDVSDVCVYLPYTPWGNKKVNNLAYEADMDFLKSILRQSQKNENKKLLTELGLVEEKFDTKVKEQRKTLKKEKEEAVRETRKHMSTLGVETLESILDEIDGLQPAIREFLAKYINAEERIKTEDLLADLIKHHNVAIKTINDLKVKDES